MGISTRNISDKVKFVMGVASIISDRKQDARKLVLDDLKVRMEKSFNAWKDLQKHRQRKTDEWTDTQLGELDDEIENMRTRYEDVKDFATLYEIQKSYKKRFNQMVSRKIIMLARKERLGLRKAACGRKK